MWKQNQCHGAKAEALPVNGLEQSVMASCAARLGSIHGGRVRGHSGARIRAPHAHRCSPLSTCVVCAPRVIVGGCCCCSGARINEWTRQGAAARCSTLDCTTRSNLWRWEQRQMSALHGFRWNVVAPRWLQWLARALLASPGRRSTGYLRRAGTGRSGPMPPLYRLARMRGIVLGRAVQLI